MMNPYTAERKIAGETADGLPGIFFKKNALKAEILNGVKNV